MNKTINFLVNKDESNLRVDIYLSKKINFLTRSNIKKLIEDQNLKINGYITALPSKKIKLNDKIEVNLLRDNVETLKPKQIKLNIIFEDKDIVIIDKPKGLVVHPGAGNYDNTLANALAFKYKKNLSTLNGQLRPGIVHRIDKNTSGIIVIAKNNLSHSKLGAQFSNHSIKRKYYCLIWGVIRPLKGRIETLISRSKKNRQLMSVSDLRGKKAITNYNTEKVFNLKDIPKISLLKCELETGRTHQIRVHLKYKGTSILGDKQYGKKSIKFKSTSHEFISKLNNLNGQALHAETLGFVHPATNKWVNFSSKIPDDFKKMLDFLKKKETS